MNENSGPEPPANQKPKAVLADYLLKCQASVALCLHRSDEYEDPEQALAAARLIKTSIELVAALEGKPPTTHRFVIERDSSP